MYLVLPLLLLLSTTTFATKKVPPLPKCDSPCDFHVVETVPRNTTYNTNLNNYETSKMLIELMRRAQKSIHIGAFYFSLLVNNSYISIETGAPQDEGVFFYNAMLSAAYLIPRVEIQIAINHCDNLPYEIQSLVDQKLVEVRTLDFKKWFSSGILHSKMIIVDSKAFYIGSANMDWKALTMFKELGFGAYDCPCLAADLERIFDIYWFLGNKNAKIPKKWDAAYGTPYNPKHPQKMPLNKFQASFTVSPPKFRAPGRADDIDTIVSIIHHAKKFVHVASEEYAAASLFNGNKNYYWSTIDDALRRAVYNNRVHVRLLISKYSWMPSLSIGFLRSLQDFQAAIPEGKGSIEVRLFEIPNYEIFNSTKTIQRKSHSKYLVTENIAFVSTSNWSADYFTVAGGISMVLQGLNNTVANEVAAVQKIFMRDWNSQYSTSIDKFSNNGTSDKKYRDLKFGDF